MQSGLPELDLFDSALQLWGEETLISLWTVDGVGDEDFVLDAIIILNEPADGS